ncbi:MAG TPA: FHA domain-containing protein, partial [Thermoanaerobaculia bacterium]|nr:FHA domain-containing protein [Thermoanaerobaculia bacterium]
MPPSLVALSGRLQGRTFDLPGDGLAIGRNPANDLAIPEATVSRHHCALRCAGGIWHVADLDSRHGTFLNGRPVHEEALHHGDILGIGDSTFLVLLDVTAGAEKEGTGEIELEAGTEIRLPAGESVYLRPEPTRDGAARALAALIDLAAACGAPRETG